MSPFLVQDPLFNAMLIKSNAALLELYKILGSADDKINSLMQWQSRAINRFNEKLFNSKLGAYVHYDLKNEKQIEFLSSSSFSALAANIPNDERAAVIIETMMNKFGGSDRYLCASFDPDSDRFNPKKYWRGPVWINLNWLLYKGSKSYGYENVAQRLKEDSIALIKRYGFYEYFDSRKSIDVNGGYGGRNFSPFWRGI